MFNYYLFEPAYHNIGVNTLVVNCRKLNEAMMEYVEPLDRFNYSVFFFHTQVDQDRLLSDVIYDLPDKELSNLVIPRMLNKFQIIKQVHNYEELKSSFPDSICAFWGESFIPKESYCLNCKTDISSFRVMSVMQVLNGKSFKGFIPALFKKIQFCDSAFNYISGYSDEMVKQIAEKLIELDLFCIEWIAGVFSPRIVTETRSIIISYESASTNGKERCRRERMFKLPDGRIEYFEPHIKGGDYRIHIYPDNQSHIIYVGYIGPHLST